MRLNSFTQYVIFKSHIVKYVLVCGFCKLKIVCFFENFR